MNRTKLAIAVLTFALGLPSVFAQAPHPSEKSARHQLQKQAMARATELLAAGQDGAAAQALAQLSLPSKHGAVSHLQMAQRYLQLAARFSEKAEQRQTTKAARLALREVESAMIAAGPDQPGLLANAKETAGFILERFLGDPAAAREQYAAALALDPQLPGARRAADRLNQARVGSNN